MLLPDLRRFSNGSGPVMTMGYMKEWKTSNGLVLNFDDSIVNTIHQYDRHLKGKNE